MSSDVIQDTLTHARECVRLHARACTRTLTHTERRADKERRQGEIEEWERKLVRSWQLTFSFLHAERSRAPNPKGGDGGRPARAPDQQLAAVGIPDPGHADGGILTRGLPGVHALPDAHKHPDLN